MYLTGDQVDLFWRFSNEIRVWLYSFKFFSTDNPRKCHFTVKCLEIRRRSSVNRTKVFRLWCRLMAGFTEKFKKKSHAREKHLDKLENKSFFFACVYEWKKNDKLRHLVSERCCWPENITVCAPLDAIVRKVVQNSRLILTNVPEKQGWWIYFIKYHIFKKLIKAKLNKYTTLKDKKVLTMDIFYQFINDFR